MPAQGGGGLLGRDRTGTGTGTGSGTGTGTGSGSPGSVHGAGVWSRPRLLSGRYRSCWRWWWPGEEESGELGAVGRWAAPAGWHFGGKNNLLLALCRFSSSPKAGAAQAALSPGFSTANAARHGGRREHAVPAGCSSLRPSQPAPLRLRILFFWAKSLKTWGIYSHQ